jgi:hypothetical protein
VGARVLAPVFVIALPGCKRDDVSIGPFGIRHLIPVRIVRICYFLIVLLFLLFLFIHGFF